MVSYGICLCLTCFTQYDNLYVHPCCCRWHNFIPLYDWVIFLVYMYHIFFIHSSVDGHLGYSHVLATVNSGWACFHSFKMDIRGLPAGRSQDKMSWCEFRGLLRAVVPQHFHVPCSGSKTIYLPFVLWMVVQCRDTVVWSGFSNKKFWSNLFPPILSFTCLTQASHIISELLLFALSVAGRSWVSGSTLWAGTEVPGL